MAIIEKALNAALVGLALFYALEVAWVQHRTLSLHRQSVGAVTLEYVDVDPISDPASVSDERDTDADADAFMEAQVREEVRQVVVDVTRVREDLTPQQLQRIQEAVDVELQRFAESLSGRNRHRHGHRQEVTQWKETIEANVAAMRDLTRLHRDVLRGHPLPPLPTAVSADSTDSADSADSADTESTPLAALSEFLTPASFASLSNDQLEDLLAKAFHELAEGIHTHYNFDTHSLPTTATATGSCQAFLTRTSPSPSRSRGTKRNRAQSSRARGVTTAQFESFLLDQYEILQQHHPTSTNVDVHVDVLSSSSKDELMHRFQQAIQESTHNSKQAVAAMLEDLHRLFEDAADALESQQARDQNEDEDEDDHNRQCADEALVREFLEVAMVALRQHKQVPQSLASQFDHLHLDTTDAEEEEEVAKQKHELPIPKSNQSPTSPSPSPSPAMSIRNVLSLPIYPKFIQSVDSSMDFIAGYSDLLDTLIDTMGGNEEGGVGKNLDQLLKLTLDQIELVQDKVKDSAWLQSVQEKISGGGGVSGVSGGSGGEEEV